MRSGPTQPLTPDEAAEQLAVPVFHILTGLAVPVFPGSTRSSPSSVVKIQANSLPVKGLIRRQYPVSISMGQWVNAVVPVLEDDRWKVQSTMFRRALTDGRYQQQLHLIGEALRKAFVDAGYGV